MGYNQNQHTFVICAYKESPFLKDCIESLLNQKVKSKIIITTSTPNAYIREISKTYGLELYENNGEGGIANDWNFGYMNAQTPLVTIAHQDDIYKENYLFDALSAINKTTKPLIYFCDYSELRNQTEVTNNLLLHIKRLLLCPLRIKLLQNKKFWKRMVISWGNPIACPSVLYVKKNLPEPIFVSGFRSNIDWEAWEKLSKLTGSFVYNSTRGMSHRIHNESETSATIHDRVRINEDYAMFCRFWPKWIAKILTKKYEKSENSNRLEI